jgi:hypothetical protein
VHATFHTLDATHLRLALPGGALYAVPWHEVDEVRPQAVPTHGGALSHGLAVVTRARTWLLHGLGPTRTQALWRNMHEALAKAQLLAQPASPDPPLADGVPRHTLLLAGPGTGKTTALIEHAADLLARGACRPDEIAMLAFTRAAQAHLRLRLLERLGEAGRSVCVRTFHGLAADIVAQTTGHRPRLSPLADAPLAMAQVLEENMRRRMDEDPAFRARALAFFAWHLHPAREALDFSSWDDLRAHLRSLDLRTLAGERVRSRGEWLIANWLFLRGIPYVYERPIPPGLLPEGGNYRPDFFLPDHGVYIEHLGLDRAGQPPAFMEPERY